MATKMKPPSPSSVIKWTEEEWELIAKQLYSVTGPILLSSETLDEVKAKDVFVAQESALPEDRHRKLISISQGFQSVREKLKGIFAKAAAAMRQNELVDRDSVKIKEESQQQPEAVVQETVLSAPVTTEESGSRPISSTALDLLPDEATSATDVSVSNESPAKEIAAQVNASSLMAPAATTQRPDVTRTNSAHKQENVAAPQPSRDARASGRVPEPRAAQAKSPQNMATPTSGDFNEMLRPFIAMVSQEFAQALVNVITKPENRHALSGIARNLIGSAEGVSLRNAKPGGASHPTPAQQKNAERQRPPFAVQGALSSPTDTLAQDYDEDSEHDVQPLFDPKLPPSANSSDKPTVGVVGASAHDFDELQQMYPQLQLIAVAVEDVPHAGSLGQCQRVIGLREDVPAHTDEVLRHTFRNRYLRLTGGMGRVREQLGAWLDKPGSNEPRRPKFNKPRRNNGQPEGQKKRFNNHPRKQN